MAKIVRSKLDPHDAQDANLLKLYHESDLYAWWCPDCGVRVVSIEEEYMPFCQNCGFEGDWDDVQAGEFENGTADLIRVFSVNERDALRALCVYRQKDICVVCGHGMYGDSAVHEAIIKRGDLPGDPRVFNPVNCVALHHTTGCHENTEKVDVACARYLIEFYGAEVVSGFINSLGMRKIPGRARAALGAAGIFTG